MNRTMLPLLAIAAVSVGFEPVRASNPMSDKEATPTIGERLMNDAVKGTLMKMDGEYYSIKDNDGKETRIHIDQRTKLDKVVVGDHVKAYITDKQHTTTLQRVE